MAEHLCKDKKQTEKDAKKVDERKDEGKSYFRCEKCQRVSHKEAHLCKPEKVTK